MAEEGPEATRAALHGRLPGSSLATDTMNSQTHPPWRTEVGQACEMGRVLCQMCPEAGLHFQKLVLQLQGRRGTQRQASARHTVNQQAGGGS